MAGELFAIIAGDGVDAVFDWPEQADDAFTHAAGLFVFELEHPE